MYDLTDRLINRIKMMSIFPKYRSETDTDTQCNTKHHRAKRIVCCIVDIHPKISGSLSRKERFLCLRFLTTALFFVGALTLGFFTFFAIFLLLIGRVTFARLIKNDIPVHSLLA
jgi:hypothetical protein